MKKPSGPLRLRTGPVASEALLSAPGLCFRRHSSLQKGGELCKAPLNETGSQHLHKFLRHCLQPPGHGLCALGPGPRKLALFWPVCTAHLSCGLVDDAAVRDLWKPWHADALCGICPRETSKEEIREEGKRVLRSWVLCQEICLLLK